MKDKNKGKTADKTAAAPEKTKQAKFKYQPSPFFTVRSREEYAKIRKGTEVKINVKKFKKLGDAIIDELKRGLYSDCACHFVFTLYESEIVLIAEKFGSVQENFNALIGKLEEEAFVGHCAMKGIAVETAALKKMVLKIDNAGKKAGGVMNLTELLETGADTLSEYKQKSELYEKLYKQMSKTADRAFDLFEKAETVQGMQAAQGLYCDAEQEAKISKVVSDALQRIKEFFEALNAIALETGELKKFVSDAEAYINLFGETGAGFEPFMEQLEDYEKNADRECIVRRNEDIKKLKALAARVEPAVPHVGKTVYTVKLTADEKSKNKCVVCETNAEALKEAVGLAVLGLSDVVRAYGELAKSKTSAAALLSCDTLCDLGLVSPDTQNILLIDSGYPVGAEQREALAKAVLREEGGSVYLSENVYKILFNK